MGRKSIKLAKCGDPRWITTKRGQQRCALVCEGGLLRFAKGSVCEEAARRKEEEAALSELTLVGTTTDNSKATVKLKKPKRHLKKEK